MSHKNSRFRFNDDILHLLEDAPGQTEEYQKELEEIDKWEEESLLKYFDDREADKPKNLEFMCDEVSECQSFKHFGFKCKCIRANCDAEDVEWLADEYLKQVKGRITNVYDKYRRNK